MSDNIDNPSRDEGSAEKQIIVGICAMEKKSRSKPMLEIIGRMQAWYRRIRIIIFNQEVILDEPVENWPLCDCLISFYSNGFPLEKAIQYVSLRRPYVINDLKRQYDLLNRTRIYEILKTSGIRAPRHAVLRRVSCVDQEDGELDEYDDHIEVNDEQFHKPFVEKPIDAEDHNIVIYFPSAAGGGSQWLFRKVGNKSSTYHTQSNVRRTGSYLYEEYLPTDGVDVKVYAIGPFYAHAEARKSPGLDGKVERDGSGKEIRYPVILSSFEKMIARRVVLAFNQNVCGFDLLRSNGKSYVCDVNGFSFVKNSSKYYDDASNILGNMIMRQLAPYLHIPWTPHFQMDDPPLAQTTTGKMMELLCVVAVIRHGDRTPKQKMKMEIRHSKFFALFRKFRGMEKHHVKLKKPDQLQQILDLARELLVELNEVLSLRRQHTLNNGSDGVGSDSDSAGHSQTASITTLCGDQASSPPPPPPPLGAHTASDNAMARTSSANSIVFDSMSSLQIEDMIAKFEQVKDVLEMYGHFSGINRKVELKYLAFGNSPHSSTSDVGGEDDRDPRLLLILKWGGELTPAGRIQAEELGKAFRRLYPGGDDEGSKEEGLGFLRLHSTYRHDLKIYASEEGRVQTTAGAFTKGILALEGEITPILVQMVKSANTFGLLEDCHNAKRVQSTVKRFLHDYLQEDIELGPDDFARLNPLGDKSIQRCLEFLRNPYFVCERIHGLICRLVKKVEEQLAGLPKYRRGDQLLYVNESLALVEQRWVKLMKEFRRVNDAGKVHFDISKIPDIYDNAKYCYQHNAKTIAFDNIDELYVVSKYMADIVVHQEYGITLHEKLMIGEGICAPLLEKIKLDLQQSITGKGEDHEALTRLDPRYSKDISTPLRHVRTRLYFTSESHIHSLMNLLRYGDLVKADNDKQWRRAMEFLNNVTEYNYMSQLVLMLYEDTSRDVHSDERFHVELHFSPGALPCIATAEVPRLGYRSSMDKRKPNMRLTNLTPPSPDGGNMKLIGDGPPSAPIILNKLKLGSLDNENDVKFLIGAQEEDTSFSRKISMGAEIPSAITEEPEGENEDEHYDVLEKVVEETVPTPRPNKLRPRISELSGRKTASSSSLMSCFSGRKVSDDYLNEDEKTTVVTVGSSLKSSFLPHLFRKIRSEPSSKLISTAVITGKMRHQETIPDNTANCGGGDEPILDPTLERTSVVVVRNVSLPNLSSLGDASSAVDAEANESKEDDISEFVPPLRSLETLHNRLSQRQLVDWINKHTEAAHSFALSPPRTPLSREVSGLESVLNSNR